jgi:hypothetical protein
MGPRRSPGSFDQDEWRLGGDKYGLEADFEGVGTSPNYRGGSWTEQRGTHRAGPYVGLGPKGYTRSDETIYEDACQRLMRFGYVDARDIEVKVERGEVTLEGSVHDRDQKRLAEDLVDAVPGVVDVHNRIRVRHLPAVSRLASPERDED